MYKGLHSTTQEVNRKFSNNFNGSYSRSHVGLNMNYPLKDFHAARVFTMQARVDLGKSQHLLR